MTIPRLTGGPSAPLNITRPEALILLPALYDRSDPEVDYISKELSLFQMIQFHPEQRRESLRWDTNLQRLARLRCLDMLNRQYYDHVSPEGVGPNKFIRLNGVAVPDWYPDSTANSVESLNTNSEDPIAIWISFLGSSLHRDHLLGENRFFRQQSRMGIGYSRKGDWDRDNPSHLWTMWTVLTLE
jgi:uncharacterized protein YkwD